MPFTAIPVLWISNSVTDSVQQDSNHVKKHDGYIDVVVSEDLAAHDNGFSHSDDAVKANIIDSRRKWKAGQLEPKNLNILVPIGATIVGELLGQLLGRNLEPMTMNANDYDYKKFSTSYGTPLKRGYRWDWGTGPVLFPYPGLMEQLMDAMKGRLKKKHSVGSLSNLSPHHPFDPFDARYFG